MSELWLIFSIVCHTSSGMSSPNLYNIQKVQKSCVAKLAECYDSQEFYKSKTEKLSYCLRAKVLK